MDTAVNRVRFLKKLNALFASERENNYFYFSQAKYSRIPSEVFSAKTKATKLWIIQLKHFDVLKDNEENLIVPFKAGETNIQYCVLN